MSSEIRKYGCRVGKWISKALCYTIEFSVVNAHADLVFLHGHYDWRREAGRAGLNDFLLEEVINAFDKGL